jgi:hypothetical protein
MAMVDMQLALRSTESALTRLPLNHAVQIVWREPVKACPRTDLAALPRAVPSLAMRRLKPCSAHRTEE